MPSTLVLLYVLCSMLTASPTNNSGCVSFEQPSRPQCHLVPLPNRYMVFEESHTLCLCSPRASGIRDEPTSDPASPICFIDNVSAIYERSCCQPENPTLFPSFLCDRQSITHCADPTSQTLGTQWHGSQLVHVKTAWAAPLG